MGKDLFKGSVVRILEKDLNLTKEDELWMLLWFTYAVDTVLIAENRDMCIMLGAFVNDKLDFY